MVEVRIAFSCVVLRWAESRSGSSCIQLSRFQLSLPKACVSWLWKCKSTLKPPTTWCNSVCYSYLRLPFSSWRARQVYAQAAHCWDGAARIATSSGVPGFQHLHWQPWKASEHQASTVPAFITSYLFSGVQSQEIWVGGHMFCPWTKYPCVVYHHMDSEGEKRHLCTSCQGCPKCFVRMWDFVGSIPYALTPVPYTK